MLCFLLMMIYHALLCISFTCNAIETDCIAESYMQIGITMRKFSAVRSAIETSVIFNRQKER